MTDPINTPANPITPTPVNPVASNEDSNGKLWYTSKTVWINIFAAIAFIVQHYTKFIIDPQVQAAALVIVNFILRIVTKQPVVWTLKAKKCNCGCGKHE